MKRGDVMIVVAIAVVTVSSWSASVARDADRISAESFAAGREWAQVTAAKPARCNLAVASRTGPELDSHAWRAGCVAEAEMNTAGVRGP